MKLNRLATSTLLAIVGISLGCNKTSVKPPPVITVNQQDTTVSTFAGSGAVGLDFGTVSTASFTSIGGITFDSFGNLYFSNRYLIGKITPKGDVLLVAGHATIYSGLDGKGVDASFTEPNNMTTDQAGNVYVADGVSVRKITPDGMVSTVPGSNYFNGNADYTGIVIDHKGNLFVSDTHDNIILEIPVDGPSGIFAGSGNRQSTDGNGSSASFDSPVSMTIDSLDNIYISELTGCKIRKLTPNGDVTTIAGSGTPGFANGKGSAASFSYNNGLVIDKLGNLFVADQGNFRIRKIAHDGTVTTFAGNGKRASLNGLASKAEFAYPEQLAFDTNGSLYVSDANTIRKITIN